MSQETFRDAAEMEPLAFSQLAGPDHQEVGVMCLHVFDDGVDDVVHLHVRVDGVAFFQELTPQGRDQFRGSLDDRAFQFSDLSLGQVSNGQVGYRFLS